MDISEIGSSQNIQAINNQSEAEKTKQKETKKAEFFEQVSDLPDFNYDVDINDLTQEELDQLYEQMQEDNPQEDISFSDFIKSFFNTLFEKTITNEGLQILKQEQGTAIVIEGERNNLSSDVEMANQSPISSETEQIEGNNPETFEEVSSNAATSKADGANILQNQETERTSYETYELFDMYDDELRDVWDQFNDEKIDLTESQIALIKERLGIEDES